MQRKSALGWILLSGASLAAMTGAAYAQDEGAVSDEIVVTATGREAAIQDVPIAVTAVDGETIQNSGVENLLDMTQLAPSLRIGAGQSTSLGTIARIRGLGTGGDNPGFESAVGFFIDGVYRARAGIALADLPELDRIEVLRGPQGTLFGRNTSAGVISIYTARPDFDVGAWLEAGGGDLGYASARGGVNVPLVDDVFAVRLDASIRARDGFYEDFITGEDFNTQNRWQIRGQALWDITPDASLRVIADVAQTDEDCCNATILRYGSTQAVLDGTYRFAPFWDFDAYTDFVRDNFAPILNNAANTGLGVNLLPGANTLPIDAEARRVLTSPNRDFLEQVEEAGISGELNWDIGGIDLTSITAYRDWQAARGQDIDFNTVDLFYRDGLTVEFQNFSQELRLQGEAGRLNWLIGGFYSTEDLDTTDTIRFGPAGQGYINANIMAATAPAYAAGALPAIFELFDTTGGDGDLLGGDPIPSVFNVFADGGNPLQFANVYLNPISDGNGQTADRWLVDTEEFSIFTHNEFSITDNTVLTAGLRFTHQERELQGILNANLPPCQTLQDYEDSDGLVSTIIAAANNPLDPRQALAQGVFTLISLACSPQANTVANSTASNPWTGEREENEWSGTLSLAHHFSDDFMVYGGYSRGYKAGGFNADRSGFTVLFPGLFDSSLIDGNQLGFEPEFVDAFELGFRATLFGGSTFFNGTIFYQQLHDYQLNAFNGTAFITQNIPEAISRGIELELLTRPTENLTLQAGLNYTDAYNDSTVNFLEDSLVAQTPAAQAANTILEGTPLVNVPEWTATAAITYELPITDDLGMLFYVDARYDSEYPTQALGRDPISDMDSTVVFNARVGIGHPDGDWRLELWGRNLSDELIYGGFNAPLQSGTIGAFTNEPRTWGVTLRARY
ncbi:MAG: TonB-dependent receptor [Hyphomonadaceae bacterium]